MQKLPYQFVILDELKKFEENYENYYLNKINQKLLFKLSLLVLILKSETNYNDFAMLLIIKIFRIQEEQDLNKLQQTINTIRNELQIELYNKRKTRLGMFNTLNNENNINRFLSCLEKIETKLLENNPFGIIQRQPRKNANNLRSNR